MNFVNKQIHNSNTQEDKQNSNNTNTNPLNTTTKRKNSTTKSVGNYSSATVINNSKLNNYNNKLIKQ